jgi:hypothetical protein
MAARAALYRQIEALEAAMDSMTIMNLAQAVDAIRASARDHGFLALADLAHGFESMLAHAPTRVSLGPWLDALKDAVGCESLNRAAVAAWQVDLRHRAAH